MTYPGRAGQTAVAEITKIEFNPVFDENRFNAPSRGK
jgi:hypothetical protein